MIKEKRIFYTEASYFLGIVIMAFGAAFTELAEFGMSMVVAPTYILHLELSRFLPWFSFGVAEYFVQGILIAATCIIMRRFKFTYLISFVTALLYGTVLDGIIFAVSFIPNEALWVRMICFAVGTLCCSVAVSLFFHTYISPEAYELIVKELSQKFSFNINKVKMSYDCISTVIAIVLSFAFFGFGVFKGVGIGTVLCTLINGFIIGRVSAWLERRFVFKNKFDLAKYF